MAFATGAVLLLAATLAAAGIPASRISGGENADIVDHPYVVQVDFLSTSTSAWSQSGAGVIINNFNVMTSAHKFDVAAYTGPDSVRIRAGSNQRNSGGTLVGVRRLSVHPDYKAEEGFDSDIALLRLANALTFSDTIGPARLAGATQEVPDDAEVTVVGWGNTGSLGASPSNTLQQLTIKTVNQEVCAERYGSGVTDNMICYGILDGEDRKSPCFGDAGGPVTYNDLVIAIVSWGQSCANSYFPSVGTYLPAVVEWVVDDAGKP